MSKGEQTRERILVGSAQLFNRQGYIVHNIETVRFSEKATVSPANEGR